jgi:hypothetical protein
MSSTPPVMQPTNRCNPVQTIVGGDSRGLSCMEWQDLLVGVASPRAQDFANAEFVSKPGHWFDGASYAAMCSATCHDPSSSSKKFLLSHDFDSRHSHNRHRVEAGKKFVEDRRKLTAGTRHTIPLHPVLDYVPLCARVQDCIQSPIEMFFPQSRLSLQVGRCKEAFEAGHFSRSCC